MKHLRFQPQPAVPLRDQLAALLGPVVGRSVEHDVDSLLRQGSVYRDKKRWRDPGPPGEGGAWEVFWPDLPIVEFSLDPTRVVWQDEHLLVVDKPSGVNTAPSPFSDIDCLTWGVQTLLGPGFSIHAVHRLDRDTAGLILFAKHKEAELGLHTMFRDRRVRKIYEARTPAIANRQGVYRWRDTLDYRGKVQTAVTTTWPVHLDGRGRQVWMVLPHTGRPHQIRRHFARYLVPLWGDQAYAPGLYPRSEELGLACVAYRFRHPITGVRLEVSLPRETDAANLR